MPFESLKRLDATDTAALFMYPGKGPPVPKGAAGEGAPAPGRVPTALRWQRPGIMAASAWIDSA